MDPGDDTLNSEPELMKKSSPPAWQGWLVRLGSVLWVSVCAWALYGLHKEWSGFHLGDLNAALSRIGPRGIALALGFTLLSYLGNAGLAVLAQRWLGLEIKRPWQELGESFISSAFTMNAGGSVLGGGGIRMKFAAAHRTKVSDVGKVTVFSGLAGWAGHLLVCGTMLCFAPPPLDWLSPGLARVMGPVFLSASLALTLAGLIWPGKLPPPGLALVALLVSALDWLCAGLAMWVLFPEAMPLSVWSFVAVVVLAQAFAAVTHVPGGVGVLEFTIAKALGGAIAAPVLAGALVTYRLVYYLLPFFAAIAMLAVHELHLRRRVLEKSGGMVLRGWSVIAPRLASIMALGGGFILLLSANTPIEPVRRVGLEDWLPLPFVEGAHFVSSLAGALLILLARGLQRRIQAAWWLTVLLMAGGIVFSLVKGFDWEEALVLSFMLACLLPSREHFHRHAALWTYRFTLSWWLMLLSLVGAALWLGFFAARNIPYQHELWWRFTFEGDASRFLRAAVGAGCVIAFIALAQSLRPARPRRREPVAAEAVERLVSLSNHADAALAFLGDKDFTVSADGRCGLMHADQGHSRIVMGDPLGDTDAADDLLWSFVEQARNEGVRPVFYQASVTEMPRLVDMGFKLYKLGEQARVDLKSFSLEGSDARKLRQARSRFERAGLSFAILNRAAVAERLETLRNVSDAWLGEHRAGEKGFSLGRFDDDYLRRFPCAVAMTTSGEIIAFCNIWATDDKVELTVDLMRHLPDAPGGVMEAMFIELMLWGRDNGYMFFNLGVAPLSGLSTHPLAPFWNKLAARIFDRGESFYNFQGLHSFKEKFGPEWEPLYIAVPSAWSLPSALLDVTTLIGGGLRATLVKPRRNAPEKTPA